MGGLGATSFVKNIDKQLMLPVNFAIEIDRRGYNQAVFYDCGNKDFQDFILSFGFDEEYGTFSDISIISPAFDIASVNLSAGYYLEHTKQEYIVLEDLNHTIEMVKRILKQREVNDYFDYQEVKYYYPEFTKQEYDYNEDLEADWYDLTDAEWKEKYLKDKPATLSELYTTFYFE